MPLKLDVKRKLSARSDRVKCVDLHPSEPWMLVALYNGNVHIWNHESQQLIKTFEVCELPVRTSKFLPRKNYVLTGSDDMQIRVFNYNTLERVNQFEAHADYIRCIAVHPAQTFVLTSSDDMLIKLWDAEKWTCAATFEGHSHYVMQVVFNPKDNNQFASASLDRTVKVWQLGCAQAAFTLEGHEKGVNCLDYYLGGEKPYLISGADDRMVRIWDYQNKTCVQTLDGHAQNVTAVAFHPELPVLLTGSEDGTVRIWHSNTYRLESTLNYGLERVWAIRTLAGSNQVAVGYDEGSVLITMGRDEPACSMDASGKIVSARHSEILQSNVKAIGDALEEAKDGEKLQQLSVKELGACEIYPQTIQHNANGRFLVVVGDGEYIVYTSVALRNKSFGQAAEFVWCASDANTYAVREGSNTVRIFKNFKELRAFKPEFGAEAIFGGHLLGVRSVSGLAFYDWDTQELIRRIELAPRRVFWNETGDSVALTTEESFYILRYNRAAVEEAHAAKNRAELFAEDGLESAFDVLHEATDSVRTGLWLADGCFAYTNMLNRLNYFVGGETVTVAHLDRTMYLLNFIANENRLYLTDKDLNIVSYKLMRSVLEYQTAVMRRDFDTADRLLPSVPKEYRVRIASFLEKQGYIKQALAVTTDVEHQFELALKLNDLDTAYKIMTDAQTRTGTDITDCEHKWKMLVDLAVRKCDWPRAFECASRSQDFAVQLLLATSCGNPAILERVAHAARDERQFNVAFLAAFTLGNLDQCLELLIESGRLPEAAFFARTYVPSRISHVVSLWRTSLAKTNAKAAQALADPTQYENLFAGLHTAFKTEQYLRTDARHRIPASAYPQVPKPFERSPIQEMQHAEENGEFTYSPRSDSSAPVETPKTPVVNDSKKHESESVKKAEPPRAEATKPTPKPAEPAVTAPKSAAPLVSPPKPTPQVKQAEVLSATPKQAEPPKRMTPVEVQRRAKDSDEDDDDDDEYEEANSAPPKIVTVSVKAKQPDTPAARSATTEKRRTSPPPASRTAAAPKVKQTAATDYADLERELEAELHNVKLDDDIPDDEDFDD